MEEDLQQRLKRARRQILSAEARLRYYAFVSEASDDHLDQARSDWQVAEEVLWEALREREHLEGSIEAFSEVAKAMVLLMDVLAVGSEAAERP